MAVFVIVLFEIIVSIRISESAAPLSRLARRHSIDRASSKARLLGMSVSPSVRGLPLRQTCFKEASVENHRTLGFCFSAVVGTRLGWRAARGRCNGRACRCRRGRGRSGSSRVASSATPRARKFPNGSASTSRATIGACATSIAERKLTSSRKTPSASEIAFPARPNSRLPKIV